RDRIQDVALLARPQDVLLDVGQLEEGLAAVHSPGVHHGRRRGDAAAVFALRQRRGRFPRSAAQRFPRNIATERSPGEDQIQSGEQGPPHLGGYEERRVRRLPEVLSELGVFLKEGVYQDWSRREQLADLLLFESTRTERGQLTTLEKYVAAMPEGQQEIFYLFGEAREAVEHSPLLESFQAKGQEVLFLTDAIDEFVAQALTEYKGKKLQAIDKGELVGEPV